MQLHRSDPSILGWRTLEKDHRCLIELLRPGFSVLDVGCGTGAITAGIARAVKPEGHVVGVDRDEGLLEIARTEHAEIENLEFECRDATALKFRAQFDTLSCVPIIHGHCPIAGCCAKYWQIQEFRRSCYDGKADS